MNTSNPPPESFEQTAERWSEGVAATLSSTTKSIFASKVFWLQVFALLGTLVPAIRDFIAGHPTEAAAAFALVNLLLRFATHGGVTILPTPAPTVTEEQEARTSNTSGSGMGRVGLLLVTMGALMGFGLPSCGSLAEYPVTGGFYLRDPASGAKGGIMFAPGKVPSWHASVPKYDPETGELLGRVDLSGPLAKEVDAGSVK